MNKFTQNIETSTPIASNINLERLDDKAIKSLIADGYKLLDRRKREREKSIKEQIKELAATEGIKVSFREPSARKKRIANDNQSN